MLLRREEKLAEGRMAEERNYPESGGIPADESLATPLRGPSRFPFAQAEQKKKPAFSGGLPLADTLSRTSAAPAPAMRSRQEDSPSRDRLEGLPHGERDCDRLCLRGEDDTGIEGNPDGLPASDLVTA